ncbi:hypothetical protein [Bradyrhizobium symbiodeficiens]|uniref:Glycosyl transferase n=1 Tax=Bradyrhizobium symbiodeficiens TaxID=1404367 RepID=A0A6G8ZZ99_9BRAD|nr:hypothetical protein [Bradyrhizobium symbiodeficiens]QIP05537.1 hypothetical protein HAV00_04390 [Bradyrhizobium symbiodeficiens]
MPPRYAVLLKVHYWNAFAERRLRHLLDKTNTGDVYIFVDETNGPVGQIPYERVIRATETDMAELDVVIEPAGNIFWYNVDYPLYYFFRRHQSYDYYLMCEHDAVPNVDIDAFVRSSHADNVDYVGLPCKEIGWPVQTGEGAYPDSFVLHQWLNCLSLHSNRSVAFLLERRQILARRFASHEISIWPNNEVFIATEMFNNGFNVRTLADFGGVEQYTWWPPTLEDDLSTLHNQAFIHPVLEERKYIISCLRFSDLLNYRSYVRDGRLRELLGRWSLIQLTPVFLKELARQIVRRVTPTFLLKMLPSTRNAGNFRQFILRLPPAKS